MPETDATPAPIPPDLKPIDGLREVDPPYSRITVALYSMTLLIGLIAYAIITNDREIMLMVTGAVISMATQGANYFLGSSAGSARKTNLLAAAMAPR